MMKRTKLAYAIIIFVALALLAITIYIGRGTESSDSEGVNAAPSDSSPIESDSLARPRPHAIPTVESGNLERFESALPDPTLPLVDQLNSLLDEAERGNTIAICRLAISANRCREVYRNARLTIEMQSALESTESPDDSVIIDLIARSVERGDRSAEFCTGVVESQLPDVSRLVESSIHSLTPRQKTILALTQVDGSLRRIKRTSFHSQSGLYVLPQYQADHALQFLLEGFRYRDPLALEGLVLVYAPGRTFAPRGPGLWIPNPREFLFYATIMNEVYGADSLGESGVRLAHYAAQALSDDMATNIVDQAKLESRYWFDRESIPSRPLDQKISEFGLLDSRESPSC